MAGMKTYLRVKSQTRVDVLKPDRYYDDQSVALRANVLLDFLSQDRIHAYIVGLGKFKAHAWIDYYIHT